MRDQVDRKALSSHGVDGQAYAVDRDRALGRDEARERRRRVDVESRASVGVADRLDARDDTDTVDMPADQVSSEPIRESECLLEVDAAGPIESGGARQRFGRDVEG